MEDTLTALNTGFWRTREGTLIERAKGKSCVVNPGWRAKLDEVASTIEAIRARFCDALGLNRMLYEMSRFGSARHMAELEDRMAGFRGDQDLGTWMDGQRQHVIDTMNSILTEAGMQPLRGLHEH
jgi:hypothetical protein